MIIPVMMSRGERLLDGTFGDDGGLASGSTVRT